MASPFSFGTSLSSIPNTSFSNLSEPISSNGFSGAALGGGMDPVTGALVGGALSGVGALGGGVAQGKGAKSAAEQAAEAAAEQSKTVLQVSRENPLIGFGFESLSQEQDLLKGGPLARFKEFEDAQFSRAMSQGPGAQAAARQAMAQNLASRQAELNKFAPMTRFV